MGRFAEAVSVLRKATQLNPKSSIAHVQLGGALCAERQFDEALRVLEVAVKLDPESGYARNNLGAALLARGEHRQAISVLRRAVELSPKSSTALTNLGRALTAAGDVDEAISVLRKARDLDPSSRIARISLGLALYHKGGAEQTLPGKKHQIEGGLPVAVAAATYRGRMDRRGGCHSAPGRPTGPKTRQACCLLASLVETENPGEAVQALRTAVEADPGDVGTRMALAEALRRAGRYREALSAVEEARRGMAGRHPLGKPAAELRAVLMQLIRVDLRLTAHSKSEFPDEEKRIVAEVCWHRKLSGTAARLWKEALTALPEAANNPFAGLHQVAARAAVAAVAGSGEEGKKMSEEERMEWSRQARKWLEADLARLAEQFGRQPGDEFAPGCCAPSGVGSATPLSPPSALSRRGPCCRKRRRPPGEGSGPPSAQFQQKVTGWKKP